MQSALHFNSVPQTWEEYLPLGNGRLGAMVKAGISNEIYQLNEEAIWSGGPQDRNNRACYNALPKIRTLVNEGNVLDAQELGFETLSGTSFNQRVYQPAGDFKIDFFDADNFGIPCAFPLEHVVPENAKKTYQSTLDLANACTRVTYQNDDGVQFVRTSWISAVHDALFIHVKADKMGKINFRAYLDRGHWSDSIYAKNNCIFLQDAHGIPFCVGAGAVCKGGSVATNGVFLTGFNCDELLIFIDVRAWRAKNKKPLSAKQYKKQIRRNYWAKQVEKNLGKIRALFEQKDFCTVVKALFDAHLAEYKSYWERTRLVIGASADACATQTSANTDAYNAQTSENADACAVQTSENKIDFLTNDKIKNATTKSTALFNLYADFSRYLLISASRKPGTMPTTLQGLWNCYMDPPWGCKYTVNINTEMNYWPVHYANLSECELPLFELLARAYFNGVKTAKTMYHCRGYVVHHNLDLWGDTAPQDNWLPGTYWTLGAAWLATHIFEHYEWTQNKELLQKYYYLMHEAALFFVDFLVPQQNFANGKSHLAKDGKPYLVINPSVSPENSYITKKGQIGAFCAGCQMDNMILRHLFASCIKARAILGKKCQNVNKKPYQQKDFDQFDYVLNHLKGIEFNNDGTLMEWNECVKEAEPGHRHVSHLYALFPGHDISVQKTPHFAEGANKTLQKRLANGGGHTGWSQAWILNFRASLLQGDQALQSLVTLMTHSTLPNLLDNHPPFQIDGNFGALCGIYRMFLQSECNADGTVTVHLLPALPVDEAWQSGYIKGARIKGGYTIDFAWQNGKILHYKLFAQKNAIAKQKICVVTNGEA